MSTNHWLTLGYIVAWVCETLGILLGANVIRMYGKGYPLRIDETVLREMQEVGLIDPKSVEGRLYLIEARLGVFTVDQRFSDRQAIRERRWQVWATVPLLMVGGGIGLVTTLFWIY